MTNSPGHSVALADGEVTNIFNFLSCKNGWAGPGETMAVLVYHPSLGVTINYGEADRGFISVKVGDKIRRNQSIARHGHCGMLHFEVYQGKVNANQRWLPYPGGVSQDPNWCEVNSMRTKPANLLDPKPMIRSLNGKFCH